MFQLFDEFRAVWEFGDFEEVYFRFEDQVAHSFVFVEFFYVFYHVV